MVRCVTKTLPLAELRKRQRQTGSAFFCQLKFEPNVKNIHLPNNVLRSKGSKHGSTYCIITENQCDFFFLNASFLSLVCLLGSFKPDVQKCCLKCVSLIEQLASITDGFPSWVRI